MIGATAQTGESSIKKTALSKAIPSETDTDGFEKVLEGCLESAESHYENETVDELRAVIGIELSEKIEELAETKHAARGIALTLAAYKAFRPQQDVRRHKAEFAGGFAARTYDSQVTVPLLSMHSLPYNVETHWLTQTFSFAGPLNEDQVLKTTPKVAGPLTTEIVNEIENNGTQSFSGDVATLILVTMIGVRNRGKVLLTKPKNLTIDATVGLLQQHFSTKYKTNAPRLPQVAIYALYECLMEAIDRYDEFELEPLERMKAANRKSGTVGDIDVSFHDQPIEAVEVKHEVPIGVSHVTEAIAKIKTASVERYFVLSTAGVSPSEGSEIDNIRLQFFKSNGCEIIVDNLYSTLRNYLRLLRATSDFIVRYTNIVETDPDLDYEHRTVWNELCEKL